MHHIETEAKANNIGNDLELKTLNIEAISIPTFHPRLDFGALDELQGSLRRDGQQDPLLVYELKAGQYGVIDGARRLKAATEMGWAEIQCLVKTALTEAEAAHLAYVKNHERKSLNPIEEALHVRRMKEEYGFTHQELEVKGYGSTAKISQLLKLLGLAKPVQEMITRWELTKEHGIALSDLTTEKEQNLMAKHAVDFHWTAAKTKAKVKKYLAKRNGGKRHIANAITIEGEVPGVWFKNSGEMNELPSECVHMIATSPPYHVGKEYEKGSTYEEHVANVQAVMAECTRVLVPGGVMAVNVCDILNFRGKDGKDKKTQCVLMGHHYQRWLKRGKVHLSDMIIWRKPQALVMDSSPTYDDKTEHTKYRFYRNWEPIYIFRKEGIRSTPADDIAMRSKITRQQFYKWAAGVWEIEPVNPMKGHPAIWPDQLASRLIRMFSYEGETVLDPFLGSGTTVKVARELGREGIGYERELQYKGLIMERLGIAPAVEDIDADIELVRRHLGGDPRERQAKADTATESRPVTTETDEIMAELHEALVPA